MKTDAVGRRFGVTDRAALCRAAWNRTAGLAARRPPPLATSFRTPIRNPRSGSGWVLNQVQQDVFLCFGNGNPPAAFGIPATPIPEASGRESQRDGAAPAGPARRVKNMED